MKYGTPDPRNPHGMIVNPIPRIPRPHDQRPNREIGLVKRAKLTLSELIGYDDSSLAALRRDKKATPLHRRHRARNKFARRARKRNR